MTITANLPDWGAPLAGAGGQAWLVAGQPKRALASAIGLVLERDDGRPGYALESFRLSSGSEISSFGVLAMRFVGDFQLAERRHELFAQTPGVLLEALPLQDGFVRFLSATAIDMMGLDKAHTLMSAGSGVRLTLKLDGNGIASFNSLVGGGSVPIVAQIVTTSNGLAVRARGTAHIDGAPLLPLLQANPEGLWSRSGLIEALKDNRFGSAFAVETSETGIAAIDGAIDAAIDRLTALAFVLKAAEKPEDEPMWQARAEALANKKMQLALDDEFVAPRAFLLRSSAITPPEMIDRAVEDDHRAITLNTGIHMVTVDANLPPIRIGAVRTGVEITVAANPPDRPDTIRKTLTFDGATGIAAVPLRLAADEPLAFDYQTFVFALTGGAAERLEGPKLSNSDSQLTLPPSAFAVDFQRVEATASILQFGSIMAKWSGARASGAWQAEATLTQNSPVVAVAIPKDCDDLAITAELVAADGTGRLALPVVANGPLWLDLSSVPQAGPQKASFVADFGGKSGTVLVECLAELEVESGGEPTLILLRDTAPEAEFRWLPDNPFRAGFRCRWSTPGGNVSEWSPPYENGANIMMAAGSDKSDPWPGASSRPGSTPSGGESGTAKIERIDIPRLEFFASEPGAYVYRATGPRLQRTAEGKPAIQLIGSGPSAFLQLTAEWTANADRLAELATAVGERDGETPKLAPAPDTVRETALELAQQDGSYAAVATGMSLGVAPQTSLLTATLNEEQTSQLRRAMEGESGVARIRYIIDAAEPTVAEHSFAAAAHSGGTHTTSVNRTSSGGLNRHVIEAVTDLADAMKS
jgi:hypothetical protein